MSNLSYCQSCRQQAPTKYCEYTQGIGMLVLRSSRSIKGNLCRNCSAKYFRQMTGLTLVTGWWGMISFLLNIIYIVTNVSYFLSSRSLPQSPAHAFPVQVASAPPATLTGFKQDIKLRIQSGESLLKIAQFIAPRAGVAVPVAQQYVLAVAQGKA